MKILGYARPDGRIGIRNKVSIIFTTDCSRYVAQKLKLLFPEGTQTFGYPGGCAFADGPVNKLIALGAHSSSAGALVIGLGCEGTDAYKIADAIAQTGRPAEALKINETGGTYMHEEVSELMGCAEVLAKRAVNEEVAADIRTAIEDAERHCFAGGRFSWGYGNIQGGLTSIEEKSYGCLAKSGTKPLQGVLHQYGALAGKPKGYYISMSEPGSGTFSGDPEGINQFAAHGCHLAMFTTGCGSTTGGLIPVIKVISNPNRMQLIRDNADFDGTPIIRGEQTIEEMGQALYDEMLAVAAGKLTKSEIYGHYEA